jgi:hypothetical protein
MNGCALSYHAKEKAEVRERNMAKRMSTARRMDRARDNAAISRAENGARKRKEVANRTKRMKGLLNKGKFPFTPAILNWVSLQLDKPSSSLTADDCKKAAV